MRRNLTRQVLEATPTTGSLAPLQEVAGRFEAAAHCALEYWKCPCSYPFEKQTPPRSNGQIGWDKESRLYLIRDISVRLKMKYQRLTERRAEAASRGHSRHGPGGLKSLSVSGTSHPRVVLDLAPCNRIRAGRVRCWVWRCLKARTRSQST